MGRQRLGYPFISLWISELFLIFKKYLFERERSHMCMHEQDEGQPGKERESQVDILLLK